MIRVVFFFSGQVVVGSDYEFVIRQWVVILEGDEFVNFIVFVFFDDVFEMDESFLIFFFEVYFMNILDSFKNQLIIGYSNIFVVVIGLNGDVFGVFIIYSVSFNISEDGLCVEVQEQL